MQNTNYTTLFFGFSSEDTKETLVKRLEEAGQIGIDQVVASYKTRGMEPAKFDSTYFEALDRFVEACREQEVRFWLEDYAPFPTGSANGAYKEAEYADVNKLFIDERHIDISGPVPDAVIRIDSLQNVVYAKAMHRFIKIDVADRKRIGIVAYQMKDNPVNAATPALVDGSAVRLDNYVENGFLKWDIPAGQWRIFVLYSTYESSGRPYFMNLLSKESVAVEIENVHKPLYEHLKAELGKTWMGFFYDEPEIGNAGGESVFDFFMLPGRRTQNPTDCNVYPWSPEMAEEMEKRDKNWISKLPCLWYDAGEVHQDYRCDYMDAVSALVRENYNGQVYNFCQEKGIGYIGHVLEDENCHTRLGCGPGHYFRQQYYQDEAGIDVIAGQILPGRDHGTSWYGVVNSDGEFYHYGLAKMASSEAHINPLKKNRAAAECFAMYGQQGLAKRKFLLDHLMVNGVNRMLLAELPSYDASSEYSKMLVEYTNRICRLLRSSKPVIKTAILYHAEAEWRDGETAQKFQKPAAVLARNQISYDIIPADVFTFPERYDTETGKVLMINGNAYEALIIPACRKLPESVERFVKQCTGTGFPIFFSGQLPDGFEEIAELDAKISCVPTEELAEAVRAVISADLLVKAENKAWLRYSHVKLEKEHYYLLHNEAPHGEINAEVIIKGEHKVVVWDAMSGMITVPEQTISEEGYISIRLRLGQHEMKILRDAGRNSTSLDVIDPASIRRHEEKWELELPDGRRIKSRGQILPRPEDYLGYDFYGKLIYRTTFQGTGQLPKLLEFESVSDCCEIFINGQSIGKRPAAPYVYDVQDTVREGVNLLTAEIYTSAENFSNSATVFGVPMDALTAVPYTLVEPMGITGPVKWLI